MENQAADHQTTTEEVNFIRTKFHRKWCTTYVPEKKELSIYPGYGELAERERETPEDEQRREKHKEDWLKENAKCRCKKYFNEHEDGTLINLDGDWYYYKKGRKGEKKEGKVKTKETDGFGQIYFDQSGLGSSEPVKYVRLAHDDNVDDVLALLKDHWNLINAAHLPDIVISVVGGNGNFKIAHSSEKKLLNRELIDAVQTTNGWLLTDGWDSGVSKAVGEATGQSQGLMWQADQGSDLRNKIQCIGIVPWGSTYNRTCLKNKKAEAMHVAHYKMSETEQVRGGEFPLNPNHTHFLLVDDGCDQTMNVADFRARLLKEINQSNNPGWGIPVICIMIEGGRIAVKHVAAAVEKDIPTVICAGTGRGADLVASVINEYEEARSEEKLNEFKAKLRRPVIRNFFAHQQGILEMGTQKEKNIINNRIDNCIDQVVSICKKRDIVHICNASKENLNTAILSCLLDCQKASSESNQQQQNRGNAATNDKLKKQVKLGLKWNRADFIRDKVFNPPNGKTQYANERFYWNLFIESLKQELNSADFARLFIDYRLNVNARLTKSALIDLYNRKVINDTTFQHILDKNYFVHNPRQLDLKTLNNLLAFLTNGRYCNLDYNNEELENKFPQPFEELFLWAVLLEKCALAEFFWEHCPEPIIAAISGTYICKILVSNVASGWCKTVKENIISFKKDLENLAIGTIKAMEQRHRTIDQLKMMKILKRRSAKWGNANCLELAALAEDHAFLSTDACQKAIWDNTWKKGYISDPRPTFLSTFTVFPVILPELSKVPVLRLLPRITFIETKKLSDHLKGDQNDQNVEKPQPQQRSQELLRIAQFSHATSSVNILIKQEENANLLPPTNRNVSLPANHAPNAVQNQAAQAQPNNGQPLNGNANPKGRMRIINNQLSFYEKFGIFYTSPYVKFIFHAVSYLAYLVFFAFNLLFNFPEINLCTIIFLAWTFSILLEELTVLCVNPTSKKTHIDGHNCLYFDYYLLEKIGTIWSHSLFSTWVRSQVLFPAITLLSFSILPVSIILFRLFISIAFILSMCRFLKFYYLSSYLGPKILMIKKMSKHLVMFLLVLVIGLLSYTVVSQALLNPTGREAYFGVVSDLFNHGTWVLFGELGRELDDVLQHSCFNSTNTTMYDGLKCAVQYWPPPILLAAYCFIGSILLVNMLIAIFAHVFEDMQGQSEQLWKYYAFFLVREYKEKTILPPPINIFEIIYRLLRCSMKKAQKEEEKDVKIAKYLKAFENQARSNFLYQRGQGDNLPGVQSTYHEWNSNDSNLKADVQGTGGLSDADGQGRPEQHDQTVQQSSSAQVSNAGGQNQDAADEHVQSALENRNAKQQQQQPQLRHSKYVMDDCNSYKMAKIRLGIEPLSLIAKPTEAGSSSQPNIIDSQDNQPSTSSTQHGSSSKLAEGPKRQDSEDDEMCLSDMYD